MKLIKKILLTLGAILLLMQLYRPEKNTSTSNVVDVFEKETRPSEKVVTILENKCYDCHSNNTNYPWYAEISPVSLWLADHVEEGKEHFNVSEWDSYSIKKKDHKLDELIEEVEENEMPLDSYTWIHGGLTEEEKETVMQWAKEVRTSYDLPESEE